MRPLDRGRPRLLLLGAAALVGTLLIVSRSGQPPEVGRAAVPTPTHPGSSTAAPFGGILIADRGNGRLLLVNAAKRVLWQFPVKGSLPAGQRFSADDAFLSPDGKTITANEEDSQLVVRIDVATRKVVWEYGHYGRMGAMPGLLNTPDDAYPLANGDVVIADIGNCRILEVSPAKKIVREWGHSGDCRDRPPSSLAEPNGDTPLPDGGLLVTEIRGSRVVRLDANGHVVFDIRVPVVYPSDAQLDPAGNVIVADYASPGAVVAVTPAGALLWRYGPRSGPGRLDHPSLAVPLGNGLVALNDDARNRVVLLDPHTGRLVWQYGTTDAAGAGPDHLSTPDGIEVIPSADLGAFLGSSMPATNRSALASPTAAATEL